MNHMEAMRLGSPSDAHKVFEPLVGKWDVVITMWMEPGKEFKDMKITYTRAK